MSGYIADSIVLPGRLSVMADAELLRLIEEHGRWRKLINENADNEDDEAALDCLSETYDLIVSTKPQTVADILAKLHWAIGDEIWNDYVAEDFLRTLASDIEHLALRA